MPSDRVYLACEACRRKKIKCDSGLPSCSKCIKRGTNCNYIPRSKTRRRAKLSDLVGLTMENTMLKKELINGQKITLGDATAAVIDDQGFSYAINTISTVNNNNNNNNNGININNYTDNINIDINDMSTHTFIQELDLLEVPEIVKKAYTMIKTHHSYLTEDVEFQNAFNQLSLLEFHTLLDNYWKYENVNIMVVWKRIFLFDLLSEDGTSGAYSSKSLIMALLAVGSTFAYNKVLISKGYVFFELARRYLKQNELWNPTVTTPQTICLLCMFEHARGNKAEELYYSILAVNCALELGLNRDTYSSSDPFTKDQETVRRFTWWSCYQVDMLVRTSLRQAPSVKKEVTGVNPPQVSPFRYIMGLPEEKKDSYFEFFFISTVTLELFVIAGETLEFCYGRWPSVSNERRRELTRKCVEELDSFWETAQQEFGLASPQILTFKLRFCYTNMLVSGYFIEPQMLVPDEYELSSIKRCVRFAENLLLHLEDFYRLYGIWTIETFASDFIPQGLTVVLCALNYDCHGIERELKLLDFANRYIKLMLSFRNTERYNSNMTIIKTLVTEWDCDLCTSLD